jgi:hypothetical protein
MDKLTSESKLTECDVQEVAENINESGQSGPKHVDDESA